jgi:hypothetical protein
VLRRSRTPGAGGDGDRHNPFPDQTAHPPCGKVSAS